MNAQRSLLHSGKELQTAIERLSTGKKINSAADDAAGFAIAERMTSEVRGLSVAVKNINDALSFLETVDSALDTSLRLTQRINELSIQASTGTLSHSDRENVQTEIRALIDEVDRVFYDTEFNGRQALPNSSNNPIEIQIGVDDGDQAEISLSSTAAVEFLAAKEGYALWSDAPFITSADTSPPTNGLGASSFTISNSIGETLIEISAGQTAKAIEDSVNSRASSNGVFARAYTWGFLEATNATQGNALSLKINDVSITVDQFSYENMTNAINNLRELTGVTANAYDWGIQLGQTHGGDISIEVEGTGQEIKAYAPWKYDEGHTLVGGASDSVTWSGSVRFMSANEFTVDKIGDSIPTIFDSNPRTVEGSPNSSNATMADFDSLTSYFDSQFGIVLSLDDANVEHAAWAANLVSRSAMDQIIGQRAAIGSYVNRLNFTIDNLLGVSEATSKARSQIQDADFATESARLVKAQVIQQSGAAMLAQANAQPQMILSLIR